MSPRTPQQFQEIREEKTALIMSVALEHFAMEGYHNTTISHIARHAGISKGLMYNYFKSKDELLSAIIDKSMEEISQYFDPDRDGHLSEDEFELFVRKLFYVLRNKLPFWRLFYQFLMQKDVREKFLKTHLAKINGPEAANTESNRPFLSIMTKILKEYFQRRASGKPEGYDPILDFNMFIYTVEGFGMVTVFMDEVDEKYYNKTVERIIQQYK